MSAVSAVAEEVALLLPAGEVSVTFGSVRVDVPESEWLTSAASLASCGFTYFDFLTAAAVESGYEVVAHLVDPDQPSRRLILSTRPAGGGLDSLSAVFPGASWHEREAFEMFGLTFVGHPDLRRLLLPPRSTMNPLRKDFVLASRVAVPWPGAADPADRPAAPSVPTGGSGAPRRANPSRRKTLPPGVPQDWLKSESPATGGDGEAGVLDE